MGNCLPRKSTGTKASKKSTQSNNIVKPEEKTVSSKPKTSTAPNDAEVDKSKSGRQSDDGNSASRPCTASSVYVQVSAVQEQLEHAKRKGRSNNQGTTNGRGDLFSVPETKEETRFEEARVKEGETARHQGTRDQIPAPRNEHVDNMSTSGNSKLDQSINDFGSSHSRNVQDEEEGNRYLKAETYTKDSHKKAIKPHKKRRKIKELEARVEGLIKEKDKLLNRLSEIGALKLTDNNPFITDLSDKNRPDKLVEQFAELYDNEWTNAYENLTKTQGQTMVESVNFLLQALKETYNICLSSTKESAIALRKAMLSYAGLPDEDSIEVELQEIEKKMLEYRTKKSQCNCSRIEKEVREWLRGQFQQLETNTSNILSLYIDECVRICWYMCTKNPPMHLDFGENEKKTTIVNKTSVVRYFDNTKFMSYTKYGEYIHYVVWPAVFLHDGGPIMRKGVAQGDSAISNMLADVKG